VYWGSAYWSKTATLGPAEVPVVPPARVPLADAGADEPVNEHVNEHADGPANDPLNETVRPRRSRAPVPWRRDQGRALAAFLHASSQGRSAEWAAGIGGDDRVDVRRQPLAVREGSAPERIPPARWPSERPLVRSEQFAVDMAIGQLTGDGGLFAVHAPPGTGVTEVFGDLVAAIITQRACRIADLPDPADAFGEPLPAWGPHVVAVPAEELTGFEIVLTAPRPDTPPRGTRSAEQNGGGNHGSQLDSLLVKELRPVPPAPVPVLPALGARWRDRAAEADYFPETARLAGDDGWAMLCARLGDRAANADFTDRFWQGTARGTDALFHSGQSMTASLRRLADEDDKAVDWPAEVARFRSALAKAEALATERTAVSAALARLSSLEVACEEASAGADAAQARLARIGAREPDVSQRVLAAEKALGGRLAELGAHEISRPSATTVTPAGIAALRSRDALSIAVAGGLRRGRNWRIWTMRRRELRAACAAAERRRDAAVAAAAAFRADLAVAEESVAAAAAEVTRLAAELGPTAEAVAAARQRWGDHVPDGPAQAETEDAALIEWRETSEPWADEEYAAARAEVFFAALELHKALITARVDVVEANLAALMDLLPGDPAQAAPDAAAPADTHMVLAAWQTFFLVVPVVQAPFASAGTLFDGLGQGLLGWLLADHAESLPLRQALATLRRTDRAVFAGDTVATKDALSTRASALRVAERSARHGTWLPAEPPEDGSARQWVAAPLRVARGLDRATIDQRNEQTYDGLLVPDRD